MKTNDTASKFFNANINVSPESRNQPEFTFKMLYNEARRDLFLKNPLRKLPNTKTMSRSTSQPLLLYVPNFNPDKFNLDKKVKEIRRVIKERPLNSNEKDGLTYSKVNEQIVNESTRLLSNIHKRKMNSLNDEDRLISVFLSENKEILINNHLLRELKEEEKRIKQKEAHMTQAINKKRELFQSEQSTFEKAVDSQKRLYDEIEEILFNLQKNNKELSETEKEHKITYKLMEEEVDKYLDLIDSKRMYASFLHKVLAKDNAQFKRRLLPRKENDGIRFCNRKLNYSELAKQTIEEYDFCLNSDYNTQPILQNPEDLMEHFKIYEEMIVKKLQMKRMLTDENQREERENSQCLTELKKREDNLAKEENKLIKEHERLSSQISSCKNELGTKDIDLNTLVIELNNTIKGREDIFSLITRRTNLRPIQEIDDESLGLVRDIELKINALFSELTKYEYDSEAFYQVVNKVKQDNKKCKQIQVKNQYEQSQNDKRMRAEERFNRLVVQSRKTEAPFQRRKKVVSKEIDPEELKRIENEGLMNY